MKIEELHSTAEYTNQLAELLIRVVDDGASIGFLPPLDEQLAEAYWKTAVTPDSVLWIAKQNGRIAGSVQLHLCTNKRPPQSGNLQVNDRSRLQAAGRRQIINGKSDRQGETGRQISSRAGYKGKRPVQPSLRFARLCRSRPHSRIRGICRRRLRCIRFYYKKL